jgi:type IV secretion system protein VirB1
MKHVVNVESSRNPFAIGVVGGQLVRQPANLGEAVATVRMLEEKGYNFSLGVAQVNRANLGKYGLDSYEKAFDLCPNLVAGSQILAQCYASAGNDWGKAFSCYYSGNFTTGYQDGYVQKIFDSMARQAGVVASAAPIQLVSQTKVTNLRGTPIYNSDNAAYRVAMRSVADSAVSAAIAPMVASAAGVPAPNRASPVQQTAFTQPLPDEASIAQVINAAANGLPAGFPGQTLPMTSPGAAPGRIPTDPTTAALMSQVGASVPDGNPSTGGGRIQTDAATAAAMAQIGISANANGMAPQSNNDVYVPEVHGPNDPPVQQAPSPAAPVMQGAPAGDPADTRQRGGDGAFVF